jgi:[ribosomal protein S5]-alanine N-acetyltransferase
MSFVAHKIRNMSYNIFCGSYMCFKRGCSYESILDTLDIDNFLCFGAKYGKVSFVLWGVLSRVAGFNDGMVWEPPAHMDELYKPLQENLLAWETGTAFVFTITALHSKILLGRIGMRRSEQMNVWNIGFWTHPEYQRQGYMTEAAQALMEFGFDRLDVIRIEADYALWNKGSQRVLEKIGMKFMKYIPQGFQKKGQWIEENKMGVTKEEWLVLGHV